MVGLGRLGNPATHSTAAAQPLTQSTELVTSVKLQNVHKLRVQNENLKRELKTLAGKLEQHLQSSRSKRLDQQINRPYPNPFEHKQ